MSRLPQPGSDKDQWGDILNDYLSQSLTSDGSLKANVVGASQLQDNSIPAIKLTTALQSSLAKADSSVQSVNTKFPSSGNVTLLPADIGAAGQDVVDALSDAAAKKGQFIYVEDYRTGGVTADVAVVQAALNGLTVNGTAIFDAGRTYTINGNVSIPDVEGIRLIGNGAKIVAGTSGSPDTSYLIASQRWIEDTYAASGQPYVYMDGFEIDGGSRAAAVIIMSRRFHMHRCEVYGGDTNVKLDAQTKNGTDLGANMVECRFTDCSFHEATNYNLWVNDPATYRITDGFLINTLCFNAGTANVKIDKFSGWKIAGLHTYQYAGPGFTHGEPFTVGSGYDVDITEAGIGGKLTDSMMESGLVRVRGITATHRPTLRALHLGQTAPNGAYVDLRSTVTGGEAATVSLDDCEFYGPNGSGNYTNLVLSGPSSGAPMRVYVNGGHFGYRAPITWTNQVKVFLRGVSLYQASQSVPTDLICDGYMPTSGGRPPGIVYRTAAPSGGSEAFVVGDRWIHPAPSAGAVTGGRCVSAGSPGTWVDEQPASGAVTSAYTLLQSGYQRLDAQPTGTLALAENSAVSFTNASAGKAVFYFDPADYAISGLVTKCNIRIAVITNDTAPASTFTASLVPVSSPAGAASTLTVSAGSDTSGSTAIISAPAANATNTITSGDFNAPSAGYYALKLVVSGTGMAVGSSAQVRVELRIRNT